MTFKFFKNNENNRNVVDINLSSDWMPHQVRNDSEKESLLGERTPVLSSLGERSPSLSSLGERSPSLSSLGEHSPSLSSLGEQSETRGTINNECNILDSRVFADASHKNDSRGNIDASHKNDFWGQSSLCKERSPATRSSSKHEYRINMNAVGIKKSLSWVLVSSWGATMGESGRSMVEMLGTLAVIGVLSVGGIMGYSYGMDKWRANEIINDVNMRMIDIATQVFHNQSEIAIPEDWDIKGRSGYIIDVFQNTDSEPSLMVEKVPSSVCKEVLKSSSDTQDIYVGILNGDQVDGNWYLGDNEHICEGSDKEMLFTMSPEILAGFNPEGPDYVEPEETATLPPQLECYSNADCRPDAPYCENGTCIQCSQDSHCPSNLPYCDTAKNVCHECISNDDCGASQFCADTNESSAKATPYTCQNLSFSSIDLTNEEGITETWYYSNEPMSWWDTKMACEAMDLRMPTLSELSSGDANSVGNYKVIRPHIKTLYKTVSTITPYWITTSDMHLFLLSDGFVYSWADIKKHRHETGDGGHYSFYGVCK